MDEFACGQVDQRFLWMSLLVDELTVNPTAYTQRFIGEQHLCCYFM